MTRCHKLSEDPWEVRLDAGTATVGSLMDMMRDRLEREKEGPFASVELFSPLPRVILSAMDRTALLAEVLKGMGLGCHANLMMRCL